MLSDEEKKAIDYFRNKIGDFELFYGKKITTQENEYLKIFLNLIEKQSKEIEELKEKNKDLDEQSFKYTIKIASLQTDVQETTKLTNKNWEDKIKAKIEEVSNGTYDAKIVLQSLLEKE